MPYPFTRSASAIFCLLALLAAGTAKANSTAIESVMGGNFRQIGDYPYDKSATTAVLLADGRVFVYGTSQYMVDEEPSLTVQKLRDRRKLRQYGTTSNEPLLWNPEKRAWKKVGWSPECADTAYLHTTTLLADQNVLIAGGLCDTPKFANDAPHAAYHRLSLWNSKTEKWEAAPSLAHPRIFHSASLLKDGSVLIAAGESDPGLGAENEPVLASVERYRDGQVEPAAPLQVARARHTATTMDDGSVLVAGGVDANGKAIASVEIWDPATETWRTGPALKTARYHHSATRLADGRLMVAGGLDANGSALASVEIWDPATNTWTKGAPLLMPSQGHACVLLSDGNVLLLGGKTLRAARVRMAMLWNRDLEQWRPAGLRDRFSEWAQKQLAAPVLLPRADGSALVLGAESILQWMPSAEPTSASPLHGPREGFDAAVLADGRILLTGGVSEGRVFHDSAEIYDPVSARYSVTGRMNQSWHSHRSITLDDGRVVVAGGWARSPDTPREPGPSSPEVLDPASGRWRLIAGVRFDRHDRVDFGKLSDGRIVFFASHERAEEPRQAQAEFHAWAWNPRTGAVESLTVPMKARTHAAVAVLAGGQLLVAGGNYLTYEPEVPCPVAPEGQARAAARQAAESEESEDAEEYECRDEPAHWLEQDAEGAQLWDIRSGAVRDIDGPRQGRDPWRSEYPVTYLLRGGDVLLVDGAIRGLFDGRRLAPMRRWQAASRTWIDMPEPPALPWLPPVLELKDGTLGMDHYRLSPGASAWAETPQSPMLDDRTVQLPSGQLLALSFNQPYVTLFDDRSGQWRLRQSKEEAPFWTSAPALVALADGRLLATGQVGGSRQPVNTSFLWDPNSGLWREAGRPQHKYGDRVSAVQLPSGRVLLVGLETATQMRCESWAPATEAWTPCGSLPVDATAKRQLDRPAFGLLGDGRMALMLSRDKVFAFDERAGTWTDMTVQWQAGEFTYGAPVKQAAPLARGFDAANGAWLDISAVAGKYWEISSRIGNVLWDEQAQQWTYFFRDSEEHMGKGALFMPDGCAISRAPFRLFDAATGKVAALSDPAPWFELYKSSMAVLADGTLVLAGATHEGDHPFVHRKVSCKGLAPSAGDSVLMPAAIYRDGEAAAPQQRTVAPVAAPAPVPLKERLFRARWLILAVVVPVILYFLLSRIILPPLRRILDRANGTALGIEVTPAISPSRKRVVSYGLLAIFLLPTVVNFVRFNIMESGGDPGDGPSLLEKVTSVLGQKAKRDPLANPCRYVGVWHSGSPGLTYEVTLTEDGRYRLLRLFGTRPAAAHTGSWSVRDGNMIWRSDDRPYSAGRDINRIVDQTNSEFTLIEVDRTQTRYQLVEAGTCTP